MTELINELLRKFKPATLRGISLTAYIMVSTGTLFYFEILKADINKEHMVSFFIFFFFHLWIAGFAFYYLIELLRTPVSDNSKEQWVNLTRIIGIYAIVLPLTPILVGFVISKGTSLNDSLFAGIQVVVAGIATLTTLIYLFIREVQRGASNSE